MKLRTEINKSAEEEIIIRCQKRTEQIDLLERVIENMILENAELALQLNEVDYFVPKKDILFFETAGGKVSAHTANGMYYTDYRLFELEQIMGVTFQRISKSCIVNCRAISAIRKNLTGASEVMFRDCNKKVYLSRSYYHILRDKLMEVRGIK